MLPIVVKDGSCLDTRGAADYLAVKISTIRLWRRLGKGPKYFMAGSKLIRYRRSDLDDWIRIQLVETPSRIARV
jgi:predicted DNA-binding transcriptional regulator AlpA